jgi:hypothetical protein
LIAAVLKLARGLNEWKMSYFCVPAPKGQIVTRLLAVMVAILVAVPTVAAAKSKKRVKKPPQPQITCTVAGCAPVPPGCDPKFSRKQSDKPKGTDVTGCPHGVAPSP